MTSAAIYARVSSARQKKDQTIGSQTQAVREHARRLGLEVPEGWVFEDEGHSGATLVRPALEALRDLAAQGCVDAILCYSPDRLARKFAYQALLIEEFNRAGARVEFVNGPRGDSPEDQLLVQFQGMFAEYEKAQLMERYRRGKAYRARAGSVNVLGGAPFGYRYVRKTPESGARYEIVDHEAVLVAEMFRRYADDGATIADLGRWLTSRGILTRTGKHRWDRSVIWGMLRNPAYQGRAVFGKTQAIHEPAGLNRIARLQGRNTPRAVKTIDRPREEWTEIPVPAIISSDTFGRVQQRLADNKRFASRNSKVPSLLQGLAACSGCGYGYYRGHTTTTAGNKIYYYRCLGSDDYRYEDGRVCHNKPVRADYLDAVVWDHITGLLANPALIRAEISKRLDAARTSDPVTKQRHRLELALAKATTAITAMIEAFQEQLITIDELRARMPHLRAREQNLRSQLEAIDAQAAGRDAYLQLAGNLEGFLAQLRGNAANASIGERQRVLRLLVKNVLIGPEKITIRHRIPTREPAAGSGQEHNSNDTEGDMRPGYPLCWGRENAALRHSGIAVAQRPVLAEDASLQERLDQGQDARVGDSPAQPVHQGRMGDLVETCRDVALDDPLIRAGRQVPGLGNRVMSPPPGAEAVTTRQEIRLQDRLQHQSQRRLDHPVGDGRDPQAALLAARLGDHPLPHRHRAEAAVLQTRPQPVKELLNPHHRLHVVGTLAVHASGLGALVVPHPIPGHQQEGGIGDKVKQIVEPAMRIIPGPTVQLRLDLQYPSGRHPGDGLQLTGIHQHPVDHLPVIGPPAAPPRGAVRQQRLQPRPLLIS